MHSESMYKSNNQLSVDEKREELIDQITKLQKVRNFDRPTKDELALEYRDEMFVMTFVHDDGAPLETDDEPASKLDKSNPRLVARSWKDQPMELEQATEIVARFRVNRFPTIEVRRKPASVVDAERWYVTIGGLYGSQTLRCVSAAVAFRVIDDAIRALDSDKLEEAVHRTRVAVATSANAKKPPDGAEVLPNVNDDGEEVDEDGIPLSTIAKVNEETEALEREEANLSCHEGQHDDE